MMDRSTSVNALKKKAQDLGFDLVGIASTADPALAAEMERYHHWVDAGRGATMDYLRRHEPIKANPQLFLAGSRSVIAVGMVYGAEKPAPSPDIAQVSLYARGPDYHDVLGTKLEELATFVRNLEKGATTRIYVDKEPVLDRFWAWRAGLGWLGKNTCLINRKVGSFVFIGGIMTTLDLGADAPQPDHCGRCTKCLDACPTGALVAPHVLDARLCIAYHTIENRGEVPDSVAEKTGQWVLGCDICQDVCPWNDPVTPGRHFPVANPAWGRPLAELATWSEAHFKESVRGLAISRVKYPMFLRNVAIASKVKA